MGNDNAFRCDVAPEKSSGTLVIRSKKLPVCVLDISRVGFTILISEERVPQMERRRVYRLLFDGETCEVVKQSHYTADGQVSINLQRLERARRRLCLYKRRSRSRASISGKRSFSRRLPSKLDTTSVMYLALALLIALLVLPGVGDRLGTAARFRDGVQMFWNTSIATVTEIMEGGFADSITGPNRDAISFVSKDLEPLPLYSYPLPLGFSQADEWMPEGERHASSVGSYATSNVGPPRFSTSFLNALSSSPNADSNTALESGPSEGSPFVQEMRSRDLSGHPWVALILDSILVNHNREALIALGIDDSGAKHVLDFRLSSADSSASARALLAEIRKRGFASSHCLFAVIGGHHSFGSAVKSSFPDSVVQRCTVDAERDTQNKLMPRDWRALNQHFQLLRTARGFDAASEAFEDLQGFVAALERSAGHNLQTARSKLLALHRLNIPTVLQRSLLSSQHAENALSIAKAGGKLQLPPETNRATNSLAYALLEAEKNFGKIQGAGQLRYLVDALAVD